VHFAVTAVGTRWWAGSPTATARRPVYFVGAVLGASWGFFAFPMMNSGNYVVITASVTSA